MAVNKVVQTLSYSDIFEFPLRFPEIYRFLITSKPVGLKKIKKDIEDLRIERSQEYFFLKGRRDLVLKRRKKEKDSEVKLEKAKKVGNILGFVPGILFLGISGSLSMRNANKDDDIDLFIITSRNQVWTTRLFAILILKLLGLYRGRSDKKVKDKFCLNMLVDEDNLKFRRRDQNLYLAHEICQVLPLINRRKTYEKLIKQNSWIKNYLANYKPFISSSKNESILLFLWIFLRIIKFEDLARFIQLKYMKDRSGKEVIKNGYLGFHPTDIGSTIMNKFEAKTNTRGH